MTDEARARILALRAEGVPIVQIAATVGVHHMTIRRILDPALAERLRGASRAWKERNREANRKRDRERVARIRAGEPKRAEAPFYRFLRELS